MLISHRISHIRNGEKKRYTADTESRAPKVKPLNQQYEKLENGIKIYVDSFIRYLPSTEDPQEDLRCQRLEDDRSYQADHGVFLDLMALDISTPLTAETILTTEKRTDNTARLTDEGQSPCHPCGHATR